MQKTILIIAVVALVGCASTPTFTSDPSDPNNVKIEKAIRSAAGNPTGELTKADLEKVAKLNLHGNNLTEVPKGLEKLTQLKDLILNHNKLTSVKGLENLTQLTKLHLHGNNLTDVKGLENLTQLKLLNLHSNPDITKAQIAELQKALPKCHIQQNPTK